MGTRVAKVGTRLQRAFRRGRIDGTRSRSDSARAVAFPFDCHYLLRPDMFLCYLDFCVISRLYMTERPYLLCLMVIHEPLAMCLSKVPAVQPSTGPSATTYQQFNPSINLSGHACLDVLICATKRAYRPTLHFLVPSWESTLNSDYGSLLYFAVLQGTRRGRHGSLRTSATSSTEQGRRGFEALV